MASEANSPKNSCKRARKAAAAGAPNAIKRLSTGAWQASRISGPSSSSTPAPTAWCRSKRLSPMAAHKWAPPSFPRYAPYGRLCRGKSHPAALAEASQDVMPRSAEAVEGAHQLLGDLGGGATLDLVPFEHVHQLAVFEQAHRGRGWPVAGEIAARALGRVHIGAGEYGDGAVGALAMLQSERHAGAGFASGAAADGIDNDQGGAGLARGLIHSLRGAGLADAQAGRLFAHGRNHKFGVQGTILLQCGLMKYRIQPHTMVPPTNHAKD